MKISILTCLAAATLASAPFLSLSASAQSTAPAPAAAPQPADAKPAAAGPSSVVILFDSGSSELRPSDSATLDKVSRVYNEGKPIVMILTGTSDSTGKAEANLALSQKRATAVLNGLLERGIPAERFQVVAKGETELPVPTAKGVNEVENRRVEITWR